MKLIDADIFTSELFFAEADVCEEFPDGYCEFGLSRERIGELLQDIPTVDAVPVVRCWECENHCDTNGKHYCKFWRMYCPDDSDFFCKAGERKEGADNDT